MWLEVVRAAREGKQCRHDQRAVQRAIKDDGDAC